MYKGYIIDRKQFFRALCKVEFPALSPLRSELDLINFKNGMGLQTLSTHIFNFFEELLSIVDKNGTALDLHEFKRLFPDESILKIERIFNTINQKSSKIDIIEFEEYILRIDDVLLRDVMCSWKKVIKPKKNLEMIYLLERKQIIEECALTEDEYNWLERKFNILDYDKNGKIPKEDAVILFESGMIDVGKEIDIHFNYVTKEQITLKEFLLYIYGPIKIQQYTMNGLKDEELNEKKKEDSGSSDESRIKVIRNESEDIESLMKMDHNPSFEYSGKKPSIRKKLKKPSSLYKIYIHIYSTIKSFFKKI